MKFTRRRGGFSMRDFAKLFGKYEDGNYRFLADTRDRFFPKNNCNDYEERTLQAYDDCMRDKSFLSRLYPSTCKREYESKKQIRCKRHRSRKPNPINRRQSRRSSNTPGKRPSSAPGLEKRQLIQVPDEPKAAEQFDPEKCPAKTASDKYVYIMRHADRADDASQNDDVQKTVKNIWDPPLSPNCTDTVNHTAQWLNTYPKPDDVISSPFLRCMQTALLVRHELGCNSPIHIHKNLGEVFHPKVLKVNTIDEVIEVPNYNEIWDDKFDFMKPVEQVEMPNVNGHFPTREESRGIDGSADARFRASIHEHAKNFLCKQKKTALLIVSHGDILASAVAAFKKLHSVYEADYCGTLIFKYDCETKKFTFLCSKGVGIRKEEEAA